MPSPVSLSPCPAAATPVAGGGPEDQLGGEPPVHPRQVGGPHTRSYATVSMRAEREYATPCKPQL